MTVTNYKIRASTEGVREAKEQFSTLSVTLGDLNGVLNGISQSALQATTALQKSASDYEFSMAKAMTVANESTGSQEELSKSFFDLSERMGGAISAQQAASASYDVLSASIQKQSSLMAVLETGQKLAVAGFSNLENVTKLQSQLFNTYSDDLAKVGDETAQFNHISNILIKTQNLGQITVDEMASSLGALLPTAKSAGVSIEEVGAALATATRFGVPARSAMTDLAQVLSSLSKVGPEAEATARNLGLNFGATALKSQGLAKTLQEINEKAGDNDEALRVLFGSTEAYRTVMTMLGENTAVFNDNLRQMGDGVDVLDKAFNAMSNTSVVKTQNALNLLNNEMVKFGQGTVQTLTPVIEALAKVLQSLNALPDPVKQSIGVVATLGAGLAVATASTLSFVLAIESMMKALALAQVAGTNFTKVFAGLNATLVTVGPAMTASSAAMYATVGVYTAGVAALVASVVLLMKHLENVKQEADNLRIQEKYAETEVLVGKIEGVVGKMKKSGEALPKAEFEAWVSLMKEAQGDTESMEPHIRVLTNLQNKLSATTKESTQTSQENTRAIEQQRFAYATLVSETDSLTVAARKHLEIQTAQAELLPTQAQRIEALINAERKYTRDAIAAQQELFKARDISAAERKKAEAEILRLSTDLARKERDAKIQLGQETYNRQKALLDKAVEDAKRSFAVRGQGELEFNVQYETALRARASLEEKHLKEQVSKFKQGTRERAEAERNLSVALTQEQERLRRVRVMAVEKELAQRKAIEAKQAQELRETQKAERLQKQQAAKELRADQKAARLQAQQTAKELRANQKAARLQAQQAAKERAQEIKEAKLAADKEKEILAQRVQANQSATELMQQSIQGRIEALRLEQQTLASTENLVSAAGAGLSTLQSIFEQQTTAAENLAKAQRQTDSNPEELTRLAKEKSEADAQSVRAAQVLAQIQQTLLDNGIKLNTAGTLEQQTQSALVAIEREKLNIKERQLLLAREQQKLEANIAVQEQQSAIREAAIVNQSSATTAQEKEKANLSAELAKSKLGVLQQQEIVRDKALLQAQQELQIERSLSELKLGALNFRNNAVPFPAPSPQPVNTGGQGLQNAGNTIQIEGLKDQLLPSTKAQQTALETTIPNTLRTLNDAVLLPLRTQVQKSTVLERSALTSENVLRGIAQTEAQISSALGVISRGVGSIDNKLTQMLSLQKSTIAAITSNPRAR